MKLRIISGSLFLSRFASTHEESAQGGAVSLKLQVWHQGTNGNFNRSFISA